MHDSNIRIARYALACATAALWALVVPAAASWTPKDLLAVLAGACMGSSALALGYLMRREDARRALLAAEHERLERQLVGAIGDLYNARRPTVPLRVIPGRRRS